MKKLLFLIGTMLTVALQAQPIFAPAVKWQFTKNDSITEATKVVETDNHNFVLLYENKFSSQAFLEEVDSSGVIVWKKYVGLSYKDQQVGIGYYDLKKTPDGYIACGGYPGSSTIVVVTKTNKTGDILWNKYYWNDSYSDSYASSIDLVGDSAYVVSGSKKVSSTNSNSFLMVIDTAGNKLWWKNHYLNNLAVVVLTPKVITLGNGFGELVVCGLNNAPYGTEYFLRTNFTGDSVYSYHFPVNFHSTSFAKSNYDQSLMFITHNWDNGGNDLAQNYSTFKLDPNGLFLSQKNFSITGRSEPDISSQKDSGFIALSTGSALFGFTSYIKLNEAGDTVGVKKIGGDLGHSFKTTCLVPTSDNGCVIVGPEKDTSMYCYCPEGRARFLKLGPDHWTSTSVNTLEKEKIDLNIYPNPTTGDITVQLQNYTSKEDLIFNLYDIAGKLLVNQKVPNEKNVISLSDLPAGYYLFRVTNKQTETSGKLVLIR